MKYGFDYHGVLNIKSDKFRKIAAKLVSEGHEVHVMTGSTERFWLEESKDLLEKGIHYTHFFSVADYLKDLGIPSVGNYDSPRYEDDRWNSAKGEYAFYTGLIEHTDDFAEYAKHFPKSCKFNHVIDGEIV
jgi:hypothetical protein